jgi:hypothetical protein
LQSDPEILLAGRLLSAVKYADFVLPMTSAAASAAGSSPAIIARQVK